MEFVTWHVHAALHLFCAPSCRSMQSLSPGGRGYCNELTYKMMLVNKIRDRSKVENEFIKINSGQEYFRPSFHFVK